MRTRFFVVLFVSLTLLVLFTGGALADAVGGLAFGKSSPDTVYLMGGPDRTDGDFQNDLDPSLPDDEGWMLPYLYEPPLWHIDTVNAELLDPGQATNHAMWCGMYYPPCPGETEANPGSGPSLDEWLEWSGTVDDPLLSTEVRMTAVLNHDTEPGYDFVYFQVATAGGYIDIEYYNGANKSGGVFVPVNADLVFTVDPADYQGPGGDEIHLRWRFRSDAAFNDQDCTWPSVGAAQVDNIAVSFDQGTGEVLQTFDDFEVGSPVHWTASRANNCGFAQVWPQLNDAGYCEPRNTTPQLAFIDDGSQCDGIPSFGNEITYGPGGMVVDCSELSEYRNLAGEFWSPPIALPDMSVYESLTVSFDLYLHQAVYEGPLAYVMVRSSRDGGGTWSSWSGLRAGTWWGAGVPTDTRIAYPFQGWIRDGSDTFQIALGTKRIYFANNCSESSPAPYFDNVEVMAYRNTGPVLFDMLMPDPFIPDNFPTNGAVDTSNLAANDVRLSYLTHKVSLPRTGSTLVGPLELHWVLKPNPLFDPFRTNLPANPIVSDFVEDDYDRNGFPTSDYAFTFPSSGFVFPGDELHFYFRVQDDVAGDIGTTIMPADTTGFGRFEEGQTGLPGSYPQRYIFRGLPTLSAAHPDSQPKILVWDASGHARESEDLMLSLAQLGFRPGRDYDLLRDDKLGFNNSSSIKEGHFGYETILAVRGDEYYAHDPSIDTWLAQGGRNLLLMSTHVGSAYSGNDPPPVAITGAAREQTSVKPFIGDQNRPQLASTGAVPGISVPLVADGCDLPGFDAMALRNTGQALYEFTAPGGGSGGYPYLPAIYNYLAADDAKVITMPIPFSRLSSPDRFGGGLPARTVFLGQVLGFFGHGGTHEPTPVPVLGEFSVKAYPNPFNPRTTIAFNLPQKSAVDLHIYDLAGRKVRTLLNGEEMPAGPNTVFWTGRNNQDRSVAAGVYFFRLEAGPHQAVRRITLLK